MSASKESSETTESKTKAEPHENNFSFNAISTSSLKNMSSTNVLSKSSSRRRISIRDTTATSTPVTSHSQKRRSSTRSIKRKKFDDELVESSLTPSQPKIEKLIRAKAHMESKATSSTASSSCVSSSTASAANTTVSSSTTTDATSSTSASAAVAEANTSSASSTSATTTKDLPSSDTPSVTSASVTTKPLSPSKTVTANISSGASLSSGNKNKTENPQVTSTQNVTPNTCTGCSISSAALSTLSKSTGIKTTPLTIAVPEVERAAAEMAEKLHYSQSSLTSPSSLTESLTPSTLHSPVSHHDRKKKDKSKRSKKSTKPLAAASTKDLGRWKPQDDLLLITAVQQTCDLTAVYLGCKFSCKFTLREIQERWYALLYDSVHSKLSIQAMSQLPQDVISQVQTQALYSKEEESKLGSIPSNHFHNSQPELSTFEEMLSSHPSIFHATRTPKSLQTHWLLMRQYHLLPDQTVQPMPKGDHVLNFSDAEDMINDDELNDEKDEELEHELHVADRRQKKEIRHLEAELPKWQVLVDSVTGISPQEFDNQTLAVLRGRLVRYLMRSKEITLGRSTKDNPIDVDLTLEGPAWKVSRRQGVIKLKNNGDFYIANEGKRPIYVDSRPVMRGSKHKLNNNSVIELTCLRFIFLINTELISVIKHESQKI